jgi:hypothetical protein
MPSSSYKDYAPLPSFLTIKQSTIHGLGLFTTEDIKMGTDLGQSHYLCKDGFIRLPLGGFVNHSSTPNLKLVRKKGTRFFHAITIKFVQAGSELTGAYL